MYDEGIETNKRVVAELMVKMKLRAKGHQRRKASYNKIERIEEKLKENLINREFNNHNVDEIWVTDNSYIKCIDGRLNLSTYIDLATRIPRCCSIGNYMKKDIVIKPLKKYAQSFPMIIHTDGGGQYHSHDYRELLESHSIEHLMSEAGTPVDNAVIESFHKTIKRELIYPNRHKTKAEMKVLIYDYLTQYYIYERIHTKFMMTPYKHQLLLGSKVVS